jgi:hypothetical protein
MRGVKKTKVTREHISFCEKFGIFGLIGPHAENHHHFARNDFRSAVA